MRRGGGWWSGLSYGAPKIPLPFPVVILVVVPIEDGNDSDNDNDNEALIIVPPTGETGGSARRRWHSPSDARWNRQD